MDNMLNNELRPLERFLSGKSVDAYNFLGSHIVNWDGKDGVVFRVWAPNALSVAVVGDFNGWNQHANYMYKISDGGVWETFIPDVQQYANYKYSVETPWHERRLKTDPYAFYCQLRPENASQIYDIEGYEWNDEDWYKFKEEHPHKNQPLNIYEVNAGSWKKNDDGSFYNYKQLAEELVPYVKELGYTHIEFMPLTEFPFDGSWGYQVTGYFAATSRYGEPKDLMYFIDKCHEAGIGVILDWVPAHFPKDGHGLARFDGTGCYEFEDWRIGEHKEWGTYIFNYSRYEVKSFLISSAMFWLNEYHFDGIRVDAVASMLYLDYNRKDGEWLPNQYGGRENLIAVEFLQELNTTVHTLRPDAMMIAEESTAWSNVTGYPFSDYGLGFDYKWNMGWMNDMLEYIKTDPLWRNYHQNELTFSMIYAYSENFILPISHDEVVYGKGALLNKMPGPYEQKFAGLRGFITYMMAHPGKKLMFMGSEIGQFDEWNANEQLQWNLLDYEIHAKLNHFFAQVNKFYRDNAAMHENDYDWTGFQWIALDDSANSIVSFRRIAYDGSEVICVASFQPVEHRDYKIQVPVYGIYEEVFNSESEEFGGCGIVNSGDITAVIDEKEISEEVDKDITQESENELTEDAEVKADEENSEENQEPTYSINITIPPLGVMYFKLKEPLAVPEPVKPRKKIFIKAIRKSKTVLEIVKAAKKSAETAGVEAVEKTAKNADAKADIAEKVEKTTEKAEVNADDKTAKADIAEKVEKTTEKAEVNADDKAAKADIAEKVEKTAEKAEVNADDKTIKADTKPVEKTVKKDETTEKSDTKTEKKSDVKSDIKAEDKSAAKAVDKAVIKAPEKAIVKAVEKNDIKADVKPGAKNSKKEEVKTTEKSVENDTNKNTTKK